MTVPENDTAADTDNPVDLDVESDDDSDGDWPHLPQLELDVCLAAEDKQPGLSRLNRGT
jgi:hypothetical protein